jgi:hypothetical protein
MRLFLVAMSAGLLALSAACPARACINDRDVNRSEREFKSSYQDRQPAGEPAPQYTPPAPDQTRPFAMLGAGSALLVGAAVITLRPTRRA